MSEIVFVFRRLLRQLAAHISSVLTRILTGSCAVRSIKPRRQVVGSGYEILVSQKYASTNLLSAVLHAECE
jgi:hypothetical protein